MSNEEFAELIKKNICNAIDVTFAIAEKSKSGHEQITVDKQTVERAKAFFEFEGFDEEVMEE